MITVPDWNQVESGSGGFDGIVIELWRNESLMRIDGYGGDHEISGLSDVVGGYARVLGS